MLGGLLASLTFIVLSIAPFLSGNVTRVMFDSGPISILMLVAWFSITIRLPFYVWRVVTGATERLSKSRLAGIQADLLRRVCLPDVDNLRVFVLRYKADEARQYLTVLDCLSNLPSELLSAVVALYSRIVLAVMWIAEKEAGLAGYLATMAVLLGSVVMSPIWLAMVLIHFLLRRHAGGFGEQLAEGLLLRVCVQGDPPLYIRAKTIDFCPSDFISPRNRRLLHSNIYEDERVFEEISRIVANGNGTSDPKGGPADGGPSESKPGPDETVCCGCRRIIRSSAWSCPHCGTVFEGLLVATLTPKSLSGPARDAYWAGDRDCRAHGQPAGAQFGDTSVAVPAYQPPLGFEDAYRAGWKRAADKLGAIADRRAGRRRGIALMGSGAAWIAIASIARRWGFTGVVRDEWSVGFLVVGVLSMAAGTVMWIIGESDE